MIRTLLITLLFVISQQSQAVDVSALTKKWQHTNFGLYLNAKEAYQMKKQHPNKVMLIDVRTRAEIHYTGMANLVDANIPYKFDTTIWKYKKNKQLGSYKKVKNQHFAQAVQNLLTAKGLDKSSPIIIMCKAGTRAPFAAKVLFKAGFKKVYTQIEGFEGKKATSGKHKGHRVVNGWKNQGLPWSYDLPSKKMYFNYASKGKTE